MNQPMLHTTSAKDLVLATAALCGELSPQAASRLVPSQSYRYHVLEDLVKAKLLRPYRRDKVKGYRLTRQAKNRLAEQSPDRYAALFSGSVRTNGYASELPRRLRMHRLGEILAIMMLCGVRVFRDEKADLFGARTQPQNSQLPAFYLAREVQALGDAAIKIKNARMTGVLLAPQRFYLVYNTGSALMRWAPASELRARTLLPGRTDSRTSQRAVGRLHQDRLFYDPARRAEETERRPVVSHPQKLCDGISGY